MNALFAEKAAGECYPAGENRMQVKERSRHGQERKERSLSKNPETVLCPEDKKKKKKNTGFLLSLVSSLLRGKIINQ